jgi:ribonuclease HI
MNTPQNVTSCAVYVDGSFLDGCIGYGAAVIINGTPAHEISGAITDPALLEHRQVGGELYAVLASLSWLKTQNIFSCEIYYDYAGVEMWPTGAWKANKELTKRYAREVRESGVSVLWRKVKAHSGDKWNDRADVLAKQGASSAKGGGSGKKDPEGSPAAAAPALLIGEKQAIVSEAGVRFSSYLSNGQIEASCAGLMNDQYARVEIYEGLDRLGIVDIYYTKQAGLKPDFRAFHDMEMQKFVAMRWISFLESLKR